MNCDDFGRLNTSNGVTCDPPSSSSSELEVKRRKNVVQWLKSVLPHLSLPINTSEEELRAVLLDGSVLCQLLDKLKPESLFTEARDSVNSSCTYSENVRRFLSALEKMGLPRFQALDLEHGSMKAVLDCLIALQTQFRMQNGASELSENAIMIKSKSMVEHYGCDDGEREESSKLRPFSSLREDRPKLESKSERALRSPVLAEAALIHHIGHKFHEVFQLKQGSYADLPDSKISEMTKSNSLDNAPTQSLLTVAKGIIDESIGRKNGEIPHRVVCLLRKVVQEIERRISTQAEHLRMQNNLFKAREEKYQSRIRVLEALATGTSEETQIVMNQLQQLKIERTKMEVKKKSEEHDVCRLMKGKDDTIEEITALKQELETARETYEHDTRRSQQEISALKQQLKDAQETYEQFCSQVEHDCRGHQEEISSLKQELETARETYKQQCLKVEDEARGSQKEIEALKKECEMVQKTYEQHCSQMEKEAKGSRIELEDKLKEATGLLTETRNRLKEVETLLESKSLQWKKTQNIYEILTQFHLGALRELKFSSQSIRQEVVKTQKISADEFNCLGKKTKALEDAAANYHAVLDENKKLHNEVQELKGNIRVYCRVRPFLPGQKDKHTIVDYVGDNGELIVMNPLKQGREGRRSFRFNKVYAPVATQAQVFSDIKPLIRSVLDGYSVCIFAYGQTGSGKTYTMTGPDQATEEEWGVNYRALNDLFQISQKRGNATAYQISVQMVEIYNEQIRDLLSTDGSQKRYP
ncbi:unnamed protein product [Cuscuta campestris]|uniref:Kinesin motor domain-containing protein n=1 Tax=Cuscuta campestris TaxID=132261 RepID=A0A484MF63_9ASTE|nr:unnamed protein product [Cuscuta campestris]